MIAKYSYLTKKGKIWTSGLCHIVNSEKYDEYYSKYLALSFEIHSTNTQIEINNINEILYNIEKLDNGEIECYETETSIFSIEIYKDKVKFEYFWEDIEYIDWSCTTDEYKRVLLGWKAFFMLPKEPESYLEIKINDIE